MSDTLASSETPQTEVLPPRLTNQPLAEAFRIEPPRPWRSLNVAELWRFRELLYFLIWRDIKVRYKQTVLGASWAVFSPQPQRSCSPFSSGSLEGCRDT